MSLTLLWLLRGLCLLLAVLVAPPAWANCTATPGAGSFGAASSRSVASSASTATTGSGFRCAGSLLSIASTNTISARISSVSNSSGTALALRDDATGDRIGFLLCQDPSCAASYGVGGRATWSSTTFVGLLGLFNAADGSLPLALRTIPGSQVSAGTYTATIGIEWTWKICSIGVLNGCLYEEGTTSSIVTVTLVVQKDCEITAPPLSFGTAALVGSFAAVTQSIAIRCTRNADYTVGISDGRHPAGGVRNMANGEHRIPYDIFFPATAQTRWGPGAAQRRGNLQATTNGRVLDGATAQTFTYRAQILPQAAAAPAGRYADMLVVDVAF